jgi:hypothetical protein
MDAVHQIYQDILNNYYADRKQLPRIVLPYVYANLYCINNRVNTRKSMIHYNTKQSFNIVTYDEFVMINSN